MIHENIQRWVRTSNCGNSIDLKANLCCLLPGKYFVLSVGYKNLTNFYIQLNERARIEREFSRYYIYIGYTNSIIEEFLRIFIRERFDGRWRWMYLSFFFYSFRRKFFKQRIVVTERISNLKWRTLSSDTEYGTKSKVIVSSQRSELDFEASNCKVAHTYKKRIKFVVNQIFIRTTIINFIISNFSLIIIYH